MLKFIVFLTINTFKKNRKNIGLLFGVFLFIKMNDF